MESHTKAEEDRDPGGHSHLEEMRKEVRNDKVRKLGRELRAA